MSFKDLRVGIVGAGSRSVSLRTALQLLNIRIHAICDVNKESADAARIEFGASEVYTHYEQMLDAARLDAVIIGTPMYLHAQQSILALDRGIHVLSEVTPAVSIDECRALVAAVKRARRAKYMLAENCNFYRNNLMVTEMVRQGLFGQIYYAESEYLHEVKSLIEQTPWRRTWHAGINGITYGTHCLGPVLQWMPGDRITSVSCVGSGHHHLDVKGKPYENEDSCVMLARTRAGALIKVRTDLVSDRPYSLNYQLQGTDGCYESSRGGPNEGSRLRLRALSQAAAWIDVDAMLTADALAKHYMPELWRKAPPGIVEAGHCGGDFFVIQSFFHSIVENIPPLIGIHEAMDMTLPGLISQQSIVQRSSWLPVPDSRDW